MLNTEAISDKQTPWAVECPVHGQVFLTEGGYQRQMDFPDSSWICPICGAKSEWDDNNYEVMGQHWDRWTD